MEKFKCLWCNTLKNKDDLSVIYGKNAFFNKAIFYGCKDGHIEKIQKFLQRTEKFYMHSQSSIKMSLFLYPVLILLFRNMIYWISIILTIDFSSGLFMFPFGSSSMTEKFGIQKSILILRGIALVLIVTAVIMILRYFIGKT